MRFTKDFKGKKVTVMGLGLSGGGLGAAAWLMKQGAVVTVTDLKKARELAPSIKALDKLKIKYTKVFGRHRLRDFLEADLIIKNPAVSASSTFLKKAKRVGIKIDSEVGLFVSYFPGKIIGVTGTKGKTTTTSLIYQILRAAGRAVILGGNIRKSPLAHLARANDKSLALLELSSFQLENFSEHKYSPHIAVWTNLAPDHLDRYKSMREYAEAKANIFRYQKPRDVFITNADMPLLVRQAKRAPGKVILFSTKKRVAGGFYIKNDHFVGEGKSGRPAIFGSLKKTRLLGVHNRANILAAMVVANSLGVSRKVIGEITESFKGVENRMELVRVLRGVRYINDTASTIPLSTIVALNGYSSPVVLIAGGSEKYLPLKNLAKTILGGREPGGGVKKLILLDDAMSKRLLAEMRKVNKDKVGRILVSGRFTAMRAAVREAAKQAQKGDTVLLSPGAASFGLFSNEFDRGNQFVRAVKAL